jgi:mono/diheme cytochrome c family protein
MRPGLIVPAAQQGFPVGGKICGLDAFLSLSFVFCLLFSGALAASAALPPAAARRVDFGKDIQPLLGAHCYSCHGPSEQKGGLRWDERASAFKRGEHGPIIVPGKSSESRVLKLVSGLEPKLVMPPKGKGERLSAAQIGLLRAWIEQGAVWPDSLALAPDPRRNHWAFKPPVRPALPATKNRTWARNPIDAFVLARLEKERLEPAPEADRATLLRRLSLDLIGLPPTLEELNAFLADRAPGAYERQVERLLASPHYGEQWGRHWLDVARYADTNGYEKDRPRSIWPYRDWVIAALNRDLPFDQFTLEQLAGDLLPNATVEQRVATGFLRNSMLNQEGGIEPEQFRVEAIIDRIDTLGKAFLGLTLNCCQCHDHKFDPFTQKEYYQLFAFLNNDDEAFMEVPTAKQQKKRAELVGQAQELEDKAMAQTTNLVERMAAWEKGLADTRGAWTVLQPKDWFNFATKFEKQDDGSLLGGGDLQEGSVMRVWLQTALTNITGLRLEALTNANLMYGGPGLTGHGSFLLKEFTVEAWALHNPTATNTVRIRRAVADEEAPGFGVTNAIDGNLDKGGWTPTLTVERRNQNHNAVFEFDQPVGFPGGTCLLVTLHETFDDKTKLDCHMLGSFRLSATTQSGPLEADPLTPAERQLLAIPREQRTHEQERALFAVYRLHDPGFAELNKQVDDLWRQWPDAPTTLVLHARPKPRVTHLFTRGDQLRPAQVVTPGVPSVLNPFPADAPRNRLGLAEWIVSKRSPTTARAVVNRIWQEYFGEGLVSTPEDLGTRVETPSHPKLLDWLACEFMQPTPDANGHCDPPWSMKHIHRLIVTSATYRQSSRVTPEMYARDQFDRLLERAPRFRVDGEVVQDIALSVSGLLDPKIGGPSVYPPIPANVGDTAYEGFHWPETKGPDRYRRGLYIFWKRSLPFPALNAFDVPSSETSCPRRMRSDTPLQALTTLNEKTFVEAAQALAMRVLKEGGNDNLARARFAFRLCTARVPTPFELRALLGFWQQQYARFENDTADAVEVAVPDPAKLPASVNLHQAAAWAMVSRALLNLDETITRE